MQVATRGGPFRGADRRTIRRRGEKMMAHLGLAAELSIALVDDETIHALNRDYRGKDRPTDVLAFAMREGEALAGGSDELLGDVIIAVPTARRQAQRRRRSLLDELTMLLAHGLLHLLGYDHQSADEERVMNQRAAELEAVAGRKR